MDLFSGTPPSQANAGIGLAFKTKVSSARSERRPAQFQCRTNGSEVCPRSDTKPVTEVLLGVVSDLENHPRKNSTKLKNLVTCSSQSHENLLKNSPATSNTWRTTPLIGKNL